MTARTVLFVILGIFTIVFAVAWILAIRKGRGANEKLMPTPLHLGIGFITNFFDSLGIGSFAPTASMFKLWRVVPDQHIPGTLNVGHTPPSILEAFIFIAIVEVDPTTLCALLASATFGAWFGAGIVARWPRRRVQIGMGIALLVASILFFMSNLQLFPAGGYAIGLGGPRLIAASLGNLVFGALMTLGIGIYAPCMIMISLLGMNPTTAFPIMMGSCAFLMPVASLRFLRYDAYGIQPALGLTVGGLPAVLVGAFLVKSLPLTAVKWLVIAVALYAATAMLRSAFRANADR